MELKIKNLEELTDFLYEEWNYFQDKEWTNIFVIWDYAAFEYAYNIISDNYAEDSDSECDNFYDEVRKLLWENTTFVLFDD